MKVWRVNWNSTRRQTISWWISRVFKQSFTSGTAPKIKEICSLMVTSTSIKHRRYWGWREAVHTLNTAALSAEPQWWLLLPILWLNFYLPGDMAYWSLFLPKVWKQNHVSPISILKSRRRASLDWLLHTSKQTRAGQSTWTVLNRGNWKPGRHRHIRALLMHWRQNYCRRWWKYYWININTEVPLNQIREAVTWLK